MSLGFGASFGGTGSTDTATISYTARPTAITVCFWMKGVGNGPVINSNVATTNDAYCRYGMFTNGSGDYGARMVRRYSTTNLTSTGGGRTPTGWNFWAMGHDGVATHTAEFSEPGSSNIGFAPSQSNGSGTLGSTAGTLKMGYSSSGEQTPLAAQIAEVAIFDYLMSSTDLAALAGGASPMSLATPPVWYNRLLTDGSSGSGDAVVGSLSSFSGAVFNTTDNPTVSPPNNTYTVSASEAGSATDAQVLLQFVRPNADTSVGNWTNPAGGALYPAVNEVTPDDVLYVQSGSNPTNDALLFQLSPGAVPVSTGAGFDVFGYRISSTGVASQLTVNLWQGPRTTLIASWSHNPVPSSFTTFLQTLTTAQMALITDPTSLYCEFIAS